MPPSNLSTKQPTQTATKPLISIFGSCRQDSIFSHFDVTSIRDGVNYPHYTKEILQTAKFCQNTSTIPPSMTRWIFRSGLLAKTTISPHKFEWEFRKTSAFVIEIASRISYRYNDFWLHHIATEPKYGFPNRTRIKVRDLSDLEIEEDILSIKQLLESKPILIVTHVYTRKSGKRFALANLIADICKQHDIPHLDPMNSLSNFNERDVFVEEEVLSHYTPFGHQAIGVAYRDALLNLLCNPVDSPNAAQAICTDLSAQSTGDRPRPTQTVDKTAQWQVATSKTTEKLSDKLHLNISAGKPKKVIQTWIQRAHNHKGSFWGLGDLLRGSIGLYTLCKQLDVSFDIDFSLHPVKRFLDYESSAKIPFPFFKRNSIRFEPLADRASALDYLREQLFLSNTLRFCSNMYLESLEDIAPDCQNFVRRAFTPNALLLTHIDQLCPKHPFNILHFRAGDHAMKQGGYSSELQKHLERIIAHAGTEDYFITDCPDLKQAAKAHGLNILDTKICHLGTSTDKSAIMDTLTEFFISARARKIKTSGIYPWISGFMTAVSKLYNIPLDRY